MVKIKKIAYILCLLICLMATGCSHVADRPLRGQWVMVAMLVDGEIVETKAELYTWRFHSDIVEITEQKGWHAGGTYFGYWSLTGDALTIDFKGQAGPPAELGLTGAEPNHLILTIDTKSQIIISGPNAEYYLKKSN